MCFVSCSIQWWISAAIWQNQHISSTSCNKASYYHCRSNMHVIICIKKSYLQCSCERIFSEIRWVSKNEKKEKKKRKEKENVWDSYLTNHWTRTADGGAAQTRMNWTQGERRKANHIFHIKFLDNVWFVGKTPHDQLLSESKIQNYVHSCFVFFWLSEYFS